MDTITVWIRPPLSRSDLPGLYRRVCRLLEAADARIVRCNVAGVAVDAVAVDGLARLQLAARRHGARVEVLGASPELRDLLDFAGLEGTLRYRAAAEGRTAGRADRSRGNT